MRRRYQHGDPECSEEGEVEARVEIRVTSGGQGGDQGGRSESQVEVRVGDQSHKWRPGGVQRRSGMKMGNVDQE